MMGSERLVDNGPKPGRRLMVRYALGVLLIILGLQLSEYLFLHLHILHGNRTFWEVILFAWPVYFNRGWIITVQSWICLFPPFLLYLLPKMESLRYGPALSGSVTLSRPRRCFWTYRRFAVLYLVISFLMVFGYMALAAIGGDFGGPPTGGQVFVLSIAIPGPGSCEPFLSSVLDLSGGIVVCTLIAWALCFALIQPIAIAGLLVLDRRRKEAEAGYDGRETSPAPG